MKEKRILLKVFRARTAFLRYYFLIFLTIGTMAFLYYRDGQLGYKIILAGIFLILFFLQRIEIGRIRDWWAITDSSLIESQSILDKNVREIEFESISDIDLDQPLMKRILNHGNVNIRKFLNEKSIIVKDVKDPEKFIKILQDAIKRKKENDRRKP